jgi:hypothetical protein
MPAASSVSMLRRNPRRSVALCFRSIADRSRAKVVAGQTVAIQRNSFGGACGEEETDYVERR